MGRLFTKQGDPVKDPWVLKRIHKVLNLHQALTMDGWDELTLPSRYSPEALDTLRRELFSDRGLKEMLATLIALGFANIPRDASANWVVHQAEKISGVSVRLGPAIAAAIVAGYEPLRDTVGPGCGFRRSAVT